MQEIWKDVKDFEGLYQVSNLGRVKSLPRFVRSKNNSKRHICGKILKPSLTSSGYYNFDLRRNQSHKYCLAHRLVAEAFIPNPNNYFIVNHIDGNKFNNCVENLEWCTQSYNVKESYKNGLQVAQKGKDSKCSKSILQYSKEMEIIKRWFSAREIERETGFSHSNILHCCKGSRKSACGFIWKYAD